MGGGSHCDYKNISFLFKFGTIFRLDGLSSERFLCIEGRLVGLFVLGIRQFPDWDHSVNICQFYANFELKNQLIHSNTACGEFVQYSQSQVFF